MTRFTVCTGPARLRHSSRLLCVIPEKFDGCKGAVVLAASILAMTCGWPSRCSRLVPRRCRGPWLLCALVFVGVLGCDGSDSEPTVELKPTDRAYLEGLAAELTATLPSKIDKYTEITGVSVMPYGLRYTLRMVHMPAHTVDHGTIKSARVSITERSCNDDKERYELEAGIARHYIVHGMEDLPAGRFFISDVSCRVE